MQEEFFKKLKARIDHRFYTISDVMDCEFEFSGFFKKVESGYDNFVTDDIIEGVNRVLMTGELPGLNPEFKNYSVDNELNREKLLEYIRENAYYEISEIDVNNNHVRLLISLKLLFLNFSALSDEDLKKVNHIKIKSFMGEAEIGESKKGL